MKGKKDILQYLKKEAGNLEIPDNIKPEQMGKRLEQIKATEPEQIKGMEQEQFKGTGSEQIKGMGQGQVKGTGQEQMKDTEQEEICQKNTPIEKQKNKKEGFHKSFPYPYLVAAACICLLTGAVMAGTKLTTENAAEIMEEAAGKAAAEVEVIAEGESITGEKAAAEGKIAADDTVVSESDLLAVMEYPETTYEEIYESMFGDWEEMQYRYQAMAEAEGGIMAGGAGLIDGVVAEAAADDLATNIMFQEYAAVEESAEAIPSDNAVAEAAKESTAEFGTTNVQTQGVEEADVVKNDGRYLYQKIYQKNNHTYTQAIQIVDTQDGLKEVKRIEGFDNIQEFYIWEDILVTIENKYLEAVREETHAEKEILVCGVMDDGYANRQYHEISFYNIKDRSLPVKIKTFTMKGWYDSSRISEGYFYGFSKYYAAPGEGESDYEAYVPAADGIQLKPEEILLPEENEGNCYLLLIAIDLKDPTKLTDTTAVVTDSDMYYVSSRNIYLADRLGLRKMQGTQKNRTSLLRFAYEKGKFYLQAEGEVPGELESSFSMDEYNGNLRLVTTVNEYWFEEIRDDLTGEIIGNDIIDEKQSNALYVLDPELKIIGRIEDLAEDERIYSARFLGETGYFVTFRQVDPLFSVDLKDPENPLILGELKISGFSEYLHFYGEDRLLGIGMEAEEETGRTEGMKLSMFDISDPADVKEISKLHLKNYDHSEALYNHRAVMISTGANIFGFEMEGYHNGDYKRDYAVFTYEKDQFVEVLKIETDHKAGEINSSRGTFIGDMFYLLTRNGSVKSYDLDTGELCESLTGEVS